MPPDLPSRLDYYAIGRDYIVQRSKKIDPAMVDVEGSEANVFVGSTSFLADAVTQQLAQRTNALLLSGAEEDDLDRFGLDRFGGEIPRKGASPAVGGCRIFRPSNAAGAGFIPVGTRLGTLGNVEYVSTSVATLGPSDLQTLVPCDVRAAQAGKATQVGANTIRKFLQPSLLFDQTLQVTNDLATSGGEDRETDDDYRQRIRNFWAAARRGILPAIEAGALTVPGVVTANAIETITTGGMPARVVNLYIADSSGVANLQLARLVAPALLDYRAAGIAVIISTSVPLIVSITLSLSFQAGVDTQTLATNIQAAVVEFVNSLAVNGTLYLGQLFAVLQRFAVDGLILNQSSIVSPVGDLVPPIGQNIRTTLANVTVTTP